MFLLLLLFPSGITFIIYNLHIFQPLSSLSSSHFVGIEGAFLAQQTILWRPRSLFDKLFYSKHPARMWRCPYGFHTNNFARGNTGKKFISTGWFSYIQNGVLKYSHVKNLSKWRRCKVYYLITNTGSNRNYFWIRSRSKEEKKTQYDLDSRSCRERRSLLYGTDRIR